MNPHTGKTKRLGNAKQSCVMGSLRLNLAALPLDMKCTIVVYLQRMLQVCGGK